MSQFSQRHIGGRCLVRAGFYPVSSAVFSLLLLFPLIAWSASDGADGTGHDGVTGGHGEDGQDGVHIGGKGGDGASLVYTGSAPVAVSTTPYIDADTTDLTTLAGINNGDQFTVTVDGTAHRITIYTGNTLEDVAAEIDQVLSPYEMRAEIDAEPSGDNGRLEIHGARNFLDLRILNVTGTPFSSTGLTFPTLPGTLGIAARPFSHGGNGGDGGDGTELGDGNFYFALDSAGGAGGAGGHSDYFYGNGGHGGNGGVGMTVKRSVALAVKAATAVRAVLVATVATAGWVFWPCRMGAWILRRVPCWPAVMAARAAPVARPGPMASAATVSAVPTLR